MSEGHYPFGRIRVIRIVQNCNSGRLCPYLDALLQGLIGRRGIDMELEFDEHVVIPSNN